MVTQVYYRRDAETRRMGEGKIRSRIGIPMPSLRLCVSAVILLFSISCTTQPTEVRTVIPGDALVYLETQDLGKALQAVTDNDAFRAAAKSQPDFSVLNGIKVGLAVTGFETKEEKVSDENSVLNFQPRFV